MSKEKTMLIRAVPHDLWEEIDHLCRRHELSRKDFMEQAVILFKASEEGGQQYQEAQKARAATARVAEIKDAVAAYEGALKLKRSIKKVRKNIKMMGDEKAQMNILLEIKKMDADLDAIIGEYIPKHEIPEDPKARREMGLPQEYRHDYVDIPRDFDRGLDGTPIDESEQTSFEHDWTAHFDRLKEEVEDLEKEIGKRTAKQESENENRIVEKGEREKPGHKETTELERSIEQKIRAIRMRLGELTTEKSMRDSSKKEQSKQKKPKNIKTTVFGRGFEECEED